MDTRVLPKESNSITKSHLEGGLADRHMGGDLFHLVPKDTWEEHKATQSPYYPSTYEQVPLATLFSIGALINAEGLLKLNG